MLTVGQRPRVLVPIALDSFALRGAEDGIDGFVPRGDDFRFQKQGRVVWPTDRRASCCEIKS